MATPVGGAQPAHNPSDSVNGRNPTIPAIPAVNGSAASNPDHSRKPSMTVTPAGASGFNPNGGALGASQNKSNIQFGNMNAPGSSPAPAAAVAHQSSSSLGVNQFNPGQRTASPQPSPSPIPQPASMSGGRPPSTFGGQGNGMVFGSQGGDQTDPSSRPVSSMQFGDHNRRGSGQSGHGNDMGNPSLPTGPNNRNYNPAGRGRGGYHGPGYSQQMPYSPHNSYRGGSNGRGGMQPNYQAGRGQQGPYPNSPHMNRSSPAMVHAQLGTPPMSQMHMMPNGMQGPQQGYYMAGPHQGIPTTTDPSIHQMYQMNMGGYNPMQGQYGFMPPQSPRPYQHGAYGAPMQPTYSNQGQPTSMSRQSSQMSNAPDRPGSSVGQQPHTPSVATPTMSTHPTARTPSMSQGQKSGSANFTIPEKKRAAIVIKNPHTNEVVNFKDKTPASPAPSTAAATTTSAATPPSRTPSTVEGASGKPEGAASNGKTDEERKRAMHEAVKRRIAEEARLNKADDKADMAKEASEAAEQKATEAKAEAESLEKEAETAQSKQDDAPAEVKAEKPAEPEKSSSPAPAAESKKADDEIDFDAIEAEMAAQEAEEARLEEEYQKKKAAAKEAQAKKAKEEAEQYEANMRAMERQAEEAELAREKEREGGAPADDESKRLFAELKGGAKTPASVDTPAAATPSGPSGTATPVSDVSMPPPTRGLGSKRGAAAQLTLDTKKPVEPPEPSATLKALQSAKKLEDLSKVTYPSEYASPNPALNQNAPANRGFKYDKTFLLQFQSIFKEKPSLDWDTRIRDALGGGDGETSARPGNSARTPSGMGSRSMSNRPTPAGANFGPMGSFVGGRSLPPGTTSAERFAASNAQLRGGNTVANPFQQFGRGGMGPPMGGRQPSNNVPGSPRVGGASRGASRQESKRGKHSAKQQAEENRSMPLTAGMNVGSLEVSSTGWKARSLGQQSSLGPPVGGDGHLDPEAVQRKVKAALNKMTPEKFDKIADQILAIAAQSKDESDGRTLRQVIQLTFEKATDEAHWAPMYAMFCRKMLESMSADIKDENIKDKNGSVVTGGNLFRKYLLNRCQEEFERGWKINLPGRKEGETEEAAMLSDEYYEAAAAKRRGLGLVKFIGELFKLQMLTERIMHECVKKLVDYEGLPEEAEVESLTSLLRTIGRQLDDPNSKGAGRMDIYFERINATMALPDLNSRLKYMLMDIVDLRKNGWASKDDDKGPKTIAAIREEAERKQKEDEAKRLAQQANRGRGGPMPMGRGDARSFSGYGQVPPPDNSNRVATDDLRRLGARSSRNASSTGPGSLGPTVLGPRTNSGRRGLGPGASLMGRGDDSGTSSRTGTPPAMKDKEKKDESSTNAFSALASLDNEPPTSPPSNPASPPSQKAQPMIDRARSRSPEKKSE